MAEDKRIIIWLRRSLRVSDNIMFAAAARQGGAVLPLFIWAPEEESGWAPGGASRWWLHHSLEALSQKLRACGLPLFLRAGQSAQVLLELARKHRMDSVYCDALYEPALRARDEVVRAQLNGGGIRFKTFRCSVLVEPHEVVNAAGAPFRVFTPYWRKVKDRDFGERLRRTPQTLPRAAKLESGDAASLKLLDRVDWAAGLRETWIPGEDGAQRALKRFIDRAIGAYAAVRDVPSIAGTSRLSPHLHFGEIAPERIWCSIDKAAATEAEQELAHSAQAYLRQVAWREFSYQLLYHFPETPEKPLRGEFARFPWSRGRKAFRLWQKGQTGYPLVDAGMRELWHTGWMHNRVRMVAASFLVKHLLVPWQDGARWFWDTLVDADLANNTMGWQWVSGCGADAAPYFRIFNPVLQGEKFDPDGTYVKRWCPELNAVPKQWIHRPFAAPDEVLSRAGVVLGREYPKAVVQHEEARDRALDAYERMKAAPKAHRQKTSSKRGT